MGEPGFIAFLALVVWVPICLGIFYATQPVRAVLLCAIGGALFLPELAKLDVAGLPPLDKRSLTSLALLAGTLLRSNRRAYVFLGFRGVGVLLIVLILAGFGTALTNGDAQWHGPLVFLPGLAFRDGISFAVRDFLGIAIPFLVGRALFQRRQDLEDLLSLLLAGTLFYSFFILIEARFSPQFHNWIYGYGQHDFRQTIRWGGYRPMVFMEHGLAVALFVAQGLLASVALTKARRPVFRFQARVFVPYLLFLLIVMKSLGALIYGVTGVLLMLVSRGRAQIAVAGVVAVLTLSYPLAQAAGWIPHEQLVSLVASAAPDRAESLEFRFRNENELVQKSMERSWLGWGGFGRSHLYNEEMGRDMTVTDGYWIILLSTRGLVGMFSAFLLLLTPVLVLRRRSRAIRDSKTLAMLGGLVVIQMYYVIDLLPNGHYTDLPYLFAGALLGLSRGLPQEEAEESSAEGRPPSGPRSAPAPSKPDPFDPTWVPNPSPR